MGLGNIVTAIFGGLPFCHGSGGMTAHVRGGSRHWHSNLIIGIFLIALALGQGIWGATELNYPPILLSLLLGTVGFFHLQLAAPSWKNPIHRNVLVAMGVSAFLTENLIVTLVIGIALEFFNLPRKVAV